MELGLANCDISGVHDVLMHGAFRSSLDHHAEKRMVHEVLANIFVDDKRWNAPGFECAARTNALDRGYVSFKQRMYARVKQYRNHQELWRLYRA